MEEPRGGLEAARPPAKSYIATIIQKMSTVTVPSPLISRGEKKSLRESGCN